AVREALVVALDDWSLCAAYAQQEDLANQLRALAGAADNVPWRQKCRTAVAAKDHAALKARSDEARQLSSSPADLEWLAHHLLHLGERDAAVALLRWARGRYPADFWIHFALG